MPYPTWAYFPRQTVPPPWVASFLEVVHNSQLAIDSNTNKTLESDKVVAALRDELTSIGWIIEAGKRG